MAHNYSYSVKKLKLKFLLLLCFIAFGAKAQVLNSESFDGSSFPPPGWQNVSSSFLWTQESTGNHPSQSPHSGSGEASFGSFDASAGSTALLITPLISYVSVASDTPRVSFWMYRDGGANTFADKLEVYIDTIDNISTAVKIGTVHRSRFLSPAVSSNGWYQYTFDVPNTFTGATNYIMFNAVSAFGNNIFIDDVVWGSYPPVCIAPPTPGTATSLVNPVCSGGTFNLQLNGNSSGLGQTYQWQSSLDSTTWTNISGAINSFHTASQTVNTYYRCEVTCGATTLASNPVLVYTSPYACYCISGAQFDWSSDIGNVTFGSINNGNPFPPEFNSSADNTFTNFTNLPPANVFQGQSLPISVSEIWDNSNTNSWVNVFIDLDKNGSYDPVTERVFSSQATWNAGPTTHTGIVNIPVTATIGATYMRVMSTTFGSASQSPCGTWSDGGETEDYRINIIAPPAVVPNCVTPTAPLNAATGVIINGSSLNWNSDSLATSYEVSFGTSVTPPIVDTVSFSTYALPTLTANTTYYWSIRPINGNGPATGCPVWSFTVGTQWNYCVSAATNPWDLDIGNVTFGAINNGTEPTTFSTNSNKLYTDYKSLTPATVFQGQTLNLSVSESWSFNDMGGWLDVYIDYNQDGDFTDANEHIVNASGSGSSVSTSSVTVPSGAPVGVTTMRVINSFAYPWMGGSASQLPCGTYYEGETEDYSVNVILPPTTPPACVTEISPANLSTGVILNNTTINWTSDPIATTYQIKFGTSPTPPILDTVSSTSFVLPTMAANTTYYWSIAPINFVGITTGCPVWSFTTGTQWNYCISTATQNWDLDIGNVTFGTLNNGNAIPALGNNTSDNTYTNYTSLPAPQIFQGQSLPIIVSEIWQNSDNGGWLDVYVDFNQDGDFLDASEHTVDIQGASNSTTFNGTVTVPVAAVLGVTTMRVINSFGYPWMGGSSSQLSCGTYSLGETEDYRVEITAPPSTPPNCVSFVSPVDNATGVVLNTFLNWTIDPLTTEYAVYFGTATTPPAIDTVSYNSNYALPALAMNTTYYWKIVPMNGVGSATGCPVWSFTTGTQWNYCVSEAVQQWNNDIGNVTLGTLNNGNALPSNFNNSSNKHYTNYTAIPGAQVFQGQTLPITVSEIWDNSDQGGYLDVYIDFNQDGDFADANEHAVDAPGASSSAVYSEPVTIPAGASLGSTTMRVINSFQWPWMGGSTSQLPCGTYSQGETEDYTLIVIPPPTAPPSCVNPVAPVDNATGVVINGFISWTNEPTATGYYVYYGTTNPPPVVDTITTTTWTPLANIANTTYFWKIVPFNGIGPATGCPVWKFTTGTQWNYCLSGAVQQWNNDIGNVTFGTLNNGNANPPNFNSSSNKIYTNYTSIPGAQVFQGQTLPINVSEIWDNSDQGGYLDVYIDFNQDGDFSDANEHAVDVAGVSSSAVYSEPITIPTGANLGTTTMRVINSFQWPWMGGSSSQLPCGTYSQGETEDYTLIVTPPPTTPPLCVGPVEPLNAVIDVVRNSTLSWEPDPIATSYDVFLSTTTPPSFVTNVTGTSYTPATMPANTLHYWKIVPKNAIGDAVGCTILEFTTGTKLEYCQSSAQFKWDADIGNVSIGALNNGDPLPLTFNSDASEMYTDNTIDPSVTIPDLVAGCNYVASVTNSWQNNAFTFSNWISIFIDYNQDGIFDPINERVMTEQPTPSGSTAAVTENITIPFNAAPGQTTMRVISNINGSSGQLPCVLYFTGETEDYFVNILPPPPFNAGVNAIVNPVTGCGLGSTQPVTITVSNMGTNAVTSLNVSYQIDANTPVTETITTTLASNTTMNYTFTALANLSTPGAHVIGAWTSLPSDGFTANDSMEVQVMNIAVVSTFPYIEDFESGMNGWSAGGPNSSWAFGTPAKDVIVGAASGVNSWVTGGLGTTNYPSLERSYVVSPCFDLGSMANATVRFKLWWETEENWDGAAFQYSVNGGASWSTIGLFNDPTNWYNSNTFFSFDVQSFFGSSNWWSGENSSGSGSGGWVQTQHPLPQAAVVNGVRFRIAFGSDEFVTFDGVGFDDFEVLETVLNVDLGVDTTSCNSLVLDAGVQGASYLWSTSATTQTITVNSSGTYSVTVDSVGSIAKDTIVVIINPLIINIGNDTIICDNEVLTLDPGAGFANYNWNNGSSTSQTYNVTNSGTYNVHVTDNAGCGGSDTIFVDTYPAVQLFLGNDTAICATCTMLLDAGSFNDYQWNDGSVSQTITVPADPGTLIYWVTVFDGNGCSATDTIKITRNVGVEEIGWNGAISIQPNPSTGIFTLDYVGANVDNALLEISNLEGQLIYQESLNSLTKGLKKEVNLSKVAKGVYSIKVSSNSYLFIDKLIIQ